MWKRGIIVALAAAAFGGWVFHEQDANLFVRDADDWFLGWLTTNTAAAQVVTPLPMTIVEMEKASEWRALDYALFLRALPPKTSAVVVLESLPELENNAYSRSFVESALKQPRLILPLVLQEGKNPAEAGDWLESLRIDGAYAREQVFNSVSSGPPEELRNIVPTGVSNMRLQPVEKSLEVPLYYRLGEKVLPSIIVRTLISARRIPMEDVSVIPGKFFSFGNRKQPVSSEGKFRFDTAAVQSCTRIKSSDLLFKLAADVPIDQPELSASLQEGVIFLGDTSEDARKYLDEKGNQISRTELFASILASLVNTPTLVSTPRLIVAAFIPAIAALLFLLPLLADAALRVAGLIFAVAIYIWLALLFAQKMGFAFPLFLPISMLAFGYCLAELTHRFNQPKSRGKS